MTAKDIIEQCEVLIITAGAGMGIDSGLPDFRGNEGMWKEYPALGKRNISFSDIANPKSFFEQPNLAWGFYGHRFDLYKDTKPHQGFEKLLNIAKNKKDYFVVTSNVDGAFQKAGFDTNKVYEVHGRIEIFQCTVCDKLHTPDPDFRFDINQNDFGFEGELPHCPHCGELARPNIMMFGDIQFNDTITDTQAHMFNDFMKKYDTNGTKIAIVEFGAGTAIPTIRNMGEFIYQKIDSVDLIRVNPREAQGPDGIVSITKGALDAINQDLV